MNSNNKFSILLWNITIIGLILSFYFEQEYYLLLVSFGLGAITILEYKKIKNYRDKSFLDLRLVFIYIISAVFSLLFVIIRFVGNFN